MQRESYNYHLCRAKLAQSYENGKTTLADYHIFMEELGENIKEIGVDLEDADKNLLQK
mgnify:CR=1 FL=1